MNDIELENIFQPHKEVFIESIRYLIDEFRIGVNFNRAAFPTFEDGLFWEQSYYINEMEKRVKTNLATGVLIDLLKQHNYETILPKPQYISSPNVFCEADIKFQFAIIDRNNDTVIFVRYSDTPYDKSELLEVEKDACEYYGIAHSRWIVLRWDDKDCFSDETHILLRDFFEEFLTAELHDTYVNRVKETIKEAELMLRYQTIVRFTATNVHRLLYSQYLPTIKKNFLNDKYLDISTDYFTPSEFIKANRELSEPGKKSIFSSYLSSHRYLALIGSESFAKSFITAEFLFNTYKGDEYFDFTAIAACYAKAVEQLMLKVTMNYITEMNPNDKVILRSKDKKTQQIILKDICVNSKTDDEWRKQFNTLGSLNYFWLDNKELTVLSDADRFESAALIHKYTFECRNQPFHAETLAWSAVENIRNNSLMVLQLVLGAIKVNDNTGLGIIDDEFDRMYSALIKPAKKARLLLFIFGEEKIFAKPETFNSHPPIVYDSNQRICSSTLKFIVDEAYNSDLRKGDSITISENHIPDKAFYIGKNGLVEIEW